MVTDLRVTSSNYENIWNKVLHKETIITVDNVDFPSMNPNDILTMVFHLKDRETNESSIGAYSTAIKFLNDYIVEYCRLDVDFAHLFGTKKLLDKITSKLPKPQTLVEAPIKEPELGYV